jgi:hypothetical protein
MIAQGLDNNKPLTFILITGDRDFAYATATLRNRSHKVVLISPSHSSIHSGLISQASLSFDWNADVMVKLRGVCEDRCVVQPVLDVKPKLEPVDIKPKLEPVEPDTPALINPTLVCLLQILERTTSAHPQRRTIRRRLSKALHKSQKKLGFKTANACFQAAEKAGYVILGGRGSAGWIKLHPAWKGRL